MDHAHDDQLFAMRHSLAHIMATAIQELYPSTKFGIGPVVENGFYYDVDVEPRLTEEDLPKIEAKMKEVIKANYPFEHSTMGLDEALGFFKGQTYKIELINDLKNHGTTVAKDIDRSVIGASDEAKVDEVGIYTDGPFTDLCRGPHVESTSKVGAFKLMRLSGAYWRGDEKNAQLQRIYGVGFTTKDELFKYLELLKEAEKRDHRKLGKEMDLFVFSDLVGAGLPLFTPRGTVIRDELNNFSQELQGKGGYQRVAIPHMTKVELYKTSGHYDKYPERFSVTSFESDDEFMMKPMNCPHHTQIYASRPRSYRDMPIRYMETTVVYRDEKAGEMMGLSRVRAATQDDSHAFVRPDQIESEFESIFNMIKIMYTDVFDMPYRVRLAFRDDTDKYFGDIKLWNSAQASIQKIADKLGVKYTIEEGEATFYGPKIEFVVKDALGRENQCGTIQLDFVQPERFGLEYTDDKGQMVRPVMVHKALLGSLERFMAVMIEHYAGAFPLWLAPEQIRLAPINDSKEIMDYTYELKAKLTAAGLRAEVDSSVESVGKKIRAAGLAKVPYTLIIGEQERESGKMKPRLRTGHARSDDEIGELSVEEFVAKLAQEVADRSPKSLLS
ncbi:threonine--tRNA ligase [Candidatus Saccharibacteria bacterium]|nr:threonine--tRNA ligase [Candidatus Saccharibacteria bacterium]